MKRMVDTHIHVIPCVDDGSSFTDMSVMMLIRSYEQGVYKVIATPHGFSCMADAEIVRQRFYELGECIAKSPFDISLYLGSEIFMDGTNTENIIRCLKEKILPTMNETNYVLIEFSTKINISVVSCCLMRLINEGYIPILAHAERYINLSADDISMLINVGALIQINVLSIFEEQNNAIKHRARQMLNNRFVSFLGSDSHDTYHRPPNLAAGLDYLIDNYDAQYVEDIMKNNAERLLELK